jgi:hypothetical protein
VITIATTEEDEARDMSEVLAAALPPVWAYQIYLRGTEFASRPGTAAGATLPVHPQLAIIRQLIQEAGPAGVTEVQLRHRLSAAGFVTDRGTIRRWLQADAGTGLILQAGFSWISPGDGGEAGTG